MTNNYQTKYLKYKLKYFNLLNQSGGYTLDEFNEMFNNPDINGYLKDKDELYKDPISLSEVHRNNAVYLHKQIYDANYLSEHIEKYYLNKTEGEYVLATNPMTREEYTEEDYNLIADHISGLDDKIIEKRKEIINEIKNLIQLDDNIQKEILKLEPKKRKIFLSNHKFKIFIQLDKDIQKEILKLEPEQRIIFLNLPDHKFKIFIQLDKDIQKKILKLEPEQRTIFLSNHKFKIFIQLDKDIQKEILKLEPEQRIIFLNLPDHKFKIFIQLDKDIQKKILKLEPEQRTIFLNLLDHKFKIFIKFDYVTKMNLIDNINLFNVFIEIFNNYENAQIIYLLKCNEKINKEINDQPVLVLDNIIKNDQTFINLKILKKDFIKNNVDEFKSVINELYNIYIIKNNEFLFFFPEEYMTDEIIKLHGTALKYVPEDKITFEICEVAVKEDGFALEYVPIDKMPDKEYLQICKLAVKNKGCALKYVNTDKTANNYEYIYICEISVKQSGYALEYVQNDKMTDVEYINICKLAVKQNGYALEYVHEDKMTIDQYIYIHELANSQISIYNS